MEFAKGAQRPRRTSTQKDIRQPLLLFNLRTLAAGASDDAVSCAVMLEVLHSLANQSTRLHHGVLFLFNGAEENVLQVNPLPGEQRALLS